MARRCCRTLKHRWPSLLAALALLLLLGLPHARLDALDDGDTPSKAATVTTFLYPGWNMVGWVGPDTPLADLFDTVPELVQVLAWDADTGGYRQSTPTSTGQGTSPLTPGTGLWLEVGGGAPIEWTRTASDEYVLLSLRSGWNLVGWTGGDGTLLEEALGRFGDAFAGAARWDAETQRYALYYPGAEAINNLTTLNRGDALWVYVVRDTRWAHPGTGRMVFEFADTVPPEFRAEIREEMASVMAFFAERFGAYRAELIVSVPDRDGCGATPRFIKLARPWCAAHEYFHALQYALADGHRLVPTWLTEGSATYVEELYDEDLEFRRAIAPAAASHVASIRDPESANASRLNYHLGFIAAEWLIEQAGESSLLDYYRLLASFDSWEEAFKSAFGLSIEDFYDAFEVYRAEVAPPLPHLTDEVVRPVAVFPGDVPAETRADVQAEMDAVHAFLVERFGADPAEYSVYAGSDWRAALDQARRLWWNRWWDDRVRRYSLPIAWDSGCTVGVTGWIVHALDCDRPLDHQSYINSHIRALLVNKEQRSLSPMWIEAGGAIYLGLSYQSSGATDLGDALDRYAGLVQRSQVELQELAPKELGAPKGPWESGDSEENAGLSVLAVDWLLRYAGPEALFEYFRLLPPTETRLLEPRGWQPAFEEAFGLTVDEFYEQFAAYRETLAAP